MFQGLIYVVSLATVLVTVKSQSHLDYFYCELCFCEKITVNNISGH